MLGVNKKCKPHEIVRSFAIICWVITDLIGFLTKTLPNLEHWLIVTTNGIFSAR